MDAERYSDLIRRFACMTPEEEAQIKANEALCASEGHAEPFHKMYVTVCSRCSEVLDYL